MEFTMLPMTTSEEFGRWLEEQITARGLKYVDVERQSNGEIDGPSVGRIARGKPAKDVTLRAIAKGLGMRQADVFYAAGILTEKPGEPVFADPLKAEVWQMIDRMGYDELMGIKIMAEMVLARGANEPRRGLARNR